MRRYLLLSPKGNLTRFAAKYTHTVNLFPIWGKDSLQLVCYGIHWNRYWRRSQSDERGCDFYRVVLDFTDGIQLVVPELRAVDWSDLESAREVAGGVPSFPNQHELYELLGGSGGSGYHASM